jgi:exonuclease SbcC
MTSNRYALLWEVKDGDALLPSVIDNHQAEARRPISNLSGGETFMVSLALALGLSGMASGKLRVDSLFLDEGFGTLDNEALDLAIGTLNHLRQTQGKLIGVISHIDQLKNQIGTKIEVTKLGNGRSMLSGPGVACMSVPVVPPTQAPGDSPAEGSGPKKRGRRAKITSSGIVVGLPSAAGVMGS